MTPPGAPVQPIASALPKAARMRYWRPAEHLAGLVSGYHLYALDPPSGERQRDVFQPAWPTLRFTFGADTRWRVRQPGQPWQDVPQCALFGPSSRVTWSEAGAGVTVGIGLRPRGWARLASAMASDWADRVGDGNGVLACDTEAIARELTIISSDDEVPGVFDRWLTKCSDQPEHDDATVGAAEIELLDPQVTTVAALAERTGISMRSLERLSRRAFGFAPKLLLRRARFLRSLHAMAAAPLAGRALAIDPGYTDYSHFVRDAQHFLGMSPQAFLGLDMPLLRQSLVLRQQVLGASAQALAGEGRV